MQPVYEQGVIHGRFQVLHKDHLKYLLSGKALCKHLVVGITNPDPCHTKKEEEDPKRSSPVSNPLTYYERYRLVQAALQEGGVPLQDFSVVPFPVNQPELYRYYLPMEAVFFLTIYDDWGRKKKAYFENLGLHIHLLWEVLPEEKGISGEDVRLKMAEGRNWQEDVPLSVGALLEKWKVPERIFTLHQKESPE